MEDPDTILFVIDEMGIGTKPLRRYGYSHVGTPAVLKRKKALLHNNLSCTACISLFGVEFLQFIGIDCIVSRHDIRIQHATLIVIVSYPDTLLV